MNSKRVNSHAQDFHAINSLISHYSIPHKKSNSEIDIPEPEQCPRPHSFINASVQNPSYLAAPVSVANDVSFRSQSSRCSYSKQVVHNSNRYLDCKKSIDYSKRSNSPFASPKTTPQEMERMLIIEQQIKVEKEKYKKLEKKYKDLTATQITNQNKFENLVQELQKKLEDKKGKKLSIEGIALEVKDIKRTVNNMISRLDSLIDGLDVEEMTTNCELK